MYIYLQRSGALLICVLVYMNKLISLILKLFGDSPSKLWREFGKREITVFKEAFEEMIKVLEIKEKDNE